ncbi:hypothetical protein FRC04_005271 [Tulasnella sp. 424]|nr:hypothetical protein FRC04_005271 [Tulasnella sp. 424]
MDMDNELLAEAGLRVTRPETLAQGQREMFNDHQVILNILETSRGVLSTQARETLSAVGIEIISRQPRRVLNPNGESGVVQGLANASPNRGGGIMDWAPFAQEDVVDDRGSPMQVVASLYDLSLMQKDRMDMPIHVNYPVLLESTFIVSS